MAEHDDNPRAGKAREHARLKATFGEEPGSGYAFHDEGRVERVRSIAPRRAASLAPSALAPHPTPRPTPHAEPATISADLRHVAPPDVEDYADVENSYVRDKPPLPFFSADVRASERPAASPSGAIWDALPSAVSAPPQPSALVAHSTTAHVALPAPSSELPTVPLRSPPSGEYNGPHHGRSADARFLRIEPLVARSAWDQVLVELTHERDLPPTLSLLRLIARREIDPKSDAQNRQAVAQEATLAVASLLGVAVDSPAALVIAKRLLRRNPRGLTMLAPSPGASMGLLVAGIVAGTSIGWLITRFFL